MRVLHSYLGSVDIWDAVFNKSGLTLLSGVWQSKDLPCAMQSGFLWISIWILNDNPPISSLGKVWFCETYWSVLETLWTMDRTDLWRGWSIAGSATHYQQHSQVEVWSVSSSSVSFFVFLTSSADQRRRVLSADLNLPRHVSPPRRLWR